MGECYWCHWGWPEPIAEIFLQALKQLDGNSSPLLFGPAHIVWEDHNFNNAQWCLDHFAESSNRSEYTPEQLAIVRWSLEQLLNVDARFKNEPAGFDGRNPNAFPPPNWMRMQIVNLRDV